MYFLKVVVEILFHSSGIFTTNATISEINFLSAPLPMVFLVGNKAYFLYSKYLAKTISETLNEIKVNFQYY